MSTAAGYTIGDPPTGGIIRPEANEGWEKEVWDGKPGEINRQMLGGEARRGDVLFTSSVQQFISGQSLIIADDETGWDAFSEQDFTVNQGAARKGADRAVYSAWQRVLDRIVAWVRDTFTRLVTRAVDNVPDDLAPDLPAETVERRVFALMDQVSAGLDGVPDVLASRVTTQLREGYARGESPAALRQRVAEALELDEWDDEVVRIARTTTSTYKRRPQRGGRRAGTRAGPAAAQVVAGHT